MYNQPRFFWISILVVCIIGGCTPIIPATDSTTPQISATETPSPTDSVTPQEIEAIASFAEITDGTNKIQVIDVKHEVSESITQHFPIPGNNIPIVVSFTTTDEDFSVDDCGKIESDANSWDFILGAKTYALSGEITELSCTFYINQDAKNLSFRPNGYPAVPLGF